MGPAPSLDASKNQGAQAQQRCDRDFHPVRAFIQQLDEPVPKHRLAGTRYAVPCKFQQNGAAVLAQHAGPENHQPVPVCDDKEREQRRERRRLFAKGQIFHWR